ncbi:laccase [Sanghuangporus baumii]|uniref:Laccase n=1 Tax=Sanghuangporus baumii TaxID=108892 RepID=A0A9Q5N8B8_SANBA|nr:laccase [Sanghuangporus baumii]
MLVKEPLLSPVFLSLYLVHNVFSTDVNVELTVRNAQVAPNDVECSSVIVNGQHPAPLITGIKGDRFLLSVMDNLTDPTMDRCPIVPEHSFLYNFTVPDQAGTFWYHSHLLVQYSDGLRGPFVVYDPQDPLADLYDVDDVSTVITLTDWYNRYTFSIAGHNITIVEADGVEHEQFTVDSLTIHAAQRYSFIVTMDQSVFNYWIRAIPNFPENSNNNGGMNSAILRYDGAPDQEPTTTPKANPVQMNEADLHPLINPGAPGIPEPGAADVNLRMQIGQNSDEFVVNGVTFRPPTVPVLLQILSGTTDARSLLPAGSVYSIPASKAIEVVITIAISSKEYKFKNPVRRDVVAIGEGGDEVTFRFFADNPDPWFMHCHIDWHLEGGLAIVFAEDVPDIPPKCQYLITQAYTLFDPEDWLNLCPLFNELNPDAHLGVN